MNQMKAPPSEAHPRKRATDQKTTEENSNPSTTTITTSNESNNDSAPSAERIESSGKDGAVLPSVIKTKGGSDEEGNLAEGALGQLPPTFRYTIEELLALRESHLVQAPAELSSNTPLRPGVQVKVAETNRGAGGAKSTAKDTYFGLEHIVKAQTDGGAGPQRPWPQTNRLQGATLRGVGIGRGATSAEVTGHEGNKAGANSRHGRGSGSITSIAGAKGHQDKGGGPQTGARHHGREHGGMETRSWRSTGNNRHNGSMHHGGGGGGYGADSQYGGGGQPEWMDDSIVYDESQSARRMQDLEEWKRRMREGAGGAVVGTSDETYMQGDQQLLADDARAMRESRFLRLFSANEPQQGVATADPLVAGMPLEGHPQQLERHVQQLGGSSVDGVPQQQEDQISKLLRVFGNKVSVGGHVDRAAMLNSAAPQAQVQALGDGVTVSEYAPVPNEITQAATHRVKSASPAPINEALRGIVPTSVFRKSVQPSSAPNTMAAAKRPESSASSRSGTPARNLPSWLVELSRGSASPSTVQPSANSGALGTRDLVHTLEQEFPALSLDLQQGDRQSISSLSVQASVGVPSEANGGSVRRSSGELHDADRAAGSAAVAANSAAGQTAPVPPGVSRVASTAPQEPMQMPPVVPPQGMMGVPPPHMMMPDGSMLPGMVNAPPMPGQMPPMGMVPPPGHPMGFHPNMMFGMMPPHGMYGGMAPPVNMPPPPQLNGVPASANEQQQHLLMMKMLSEMPPGMVFGQMGSALPQMPPTHIPAHTAGLPPMYTATMTYPNMSTAVAPGVANASGAAAAASQAAAFAQPLQHPQQHPQQQE